MSSDLQNRMLQWKSKPPEQTWNRITASLDADDEYAFVKKLSAFQSQPPEHVWQGIDAGLKTAQPGKGRVISFYQQYKPAFQYGSAAAAIIMVGMLISFLVTSHSPSNGFAEQSMLNVPEKQTAQTSSHQPTQAEMPNGNKLTKNKQIALSPIDKGIAQKYIALISRWKDAQGSLVSRYFVQTNQNGEAVRLSNKLYGLFACSDGLTGNECSQQIKLWQQKAATASLLSSSDFTGVLEMLKGMQEGK